MQASFAKTEYSRIDCTDSPLPHIPFRYFPWQHEHFPVDNSIAIGRIHMKNKKERKKEKWLMWLWHNFGGGWCEGDN